MLFGSDLRNEELKSRLPKFTQQTDDPIKGHLLSSMSFYNRRGGHSAQNVLADDRPSVDVDLENAKSALADARIAYMQLDAQAQQTGGAVSQSAMMAAASQLSSADNRVNQAALAHMRYNDPEAQRQRTLDRYGVSGFRNAGRLPRGVVTPMADFGISSGAGVPSRADTFARFWQQHLNHQQLLVKI